MHDNNFTVVFIGGTSYSGSTLFDMILSNDNNGFSCGEIYYLFHPRKKFHLNPTCGCGQSNCDIWHRLKKVNEKGYYKKIRSLFPELSFIVDSSKNPFWIKSHNHFLKSMGISYKNILIWKEPVEFAQSCNKRNISNWDSRWIQYHRLYFSLIDNWKAVKYGDLVTKQKTLTDVCTYLGIEYFAGKNRYWEKIHHSVFGNNAAKIHLYDDNDSNFRKIYKGINDNDKQFIESKHKTVYYNKIEDKKLLDSVHRIQSTNPQINMIQKILEQNDITSADYHSFDKNILYSNFQIFIKKYLRAAKNAASYTTIKIS